MKNKPEKIQCFGLYCWHAYPTNPKLLELLISKDNVNYNSLGNFDLLLKPGTQMFYTEEINMAKVNYLKLVVKEVHGGNRTYINNIFLFEDFPESDSIIITDSRERNMPRQSTERKGTNTFSNANNNSSSIRASGEVLRESNQKTEEKIDNYLFSSESGSNSNFLLSDSELSTRERKFTHSIGNIKHKSIQEPIMEEEEKSSYPGNTFNTHTLSKENAASVKEIITDRDKDEELEGHLLKGLHKKKTSNVNCNANSNVNSNRPIKSKINMSHNNSMNISHSRYSNYHNLEESGHINYKELDNQLKEMQSQLDQLNFNTDKLTKFKKSLNKKEDSIHEEYIEKLLNSQRGFTLDKNEDRNNKTIESIPTPLMMSPHQNFNILSNYLKDDEQDQENAEKDNLEREKETNKHNPNIYNKEKVEIDLDSEDKRQPHVENNNKILKIENKILNLENDVTTLKLQMNKLTENIDALLETKNMITQNNMNFVLEECKKLINQNVNSCSNMNTNMNSYYNTNLTANMTGKIHHPQNSERNQFNITGNKSSYFHPYNTYNQDFLYRDDEENENYHNEYYNNDCFRNTNNKSEREKKINFEKTLNKKLDDKFNSLANKLEERIYTSILKPTVDKLENSLKTNLNEVMIHLKNAEKIKKSQQLKKTMKCDKIAETFGKLAEKLDKKEKLMNEYEKKIESNTNKGGRAFSISMNTFSDSFSDI